MGACAKQDLDSLTEEMEDIKEECAEQARASSHFSSDSTASGLVHRLSYMKMNSCLTSWQRLTDLNLMDEKAMTELEMLSHMKVVKNRMDRNQQASLAKDDIEPDKGGGLP